MCVEMRDQQLAVINIICVFVVRGYRLLALMNNSECSHSLIRRVCVGVESKCLHLLIRCVSGKGGLMFTLINTMCMLGKGSVFYHHSMWEGEI